LVNAVNKFPNQIQPWFYLALLEYKINNITIAQYSITKAYDLSGQTNPNISVAYQQIMNREPLNYIK
jgi:cytochrome c-type biogenesis protein CcmH/NrfG